MDVFRRGVVEGDIKSVITVSRRRSRPRARAIEEDGESRLMLEGNIKVATEAIEPRSRSIDGKRHVYVRDGDARPHVDGARVGHTKGILVWNGSAKAVVIEIVLLG